jgi:hypothetical protein
MKAVVTALAAIAVGFSMSASAQTVDSNSADTTFTPRFNTLPPHAIVSRAHPRTGLLPVWTTTFSHGSKTYRDQMVGTDPSASNTTTTIPVYIIPVKLVYGRSNGNQTFDPLATTVANGSTVIQDVLASPIFNTGHDFAPGGTDLGSTQYLDAFQRGNFWGSVQTNTNYHVMLGSPTVLAEQTITVTTGGKVITQSGVKIGTINQNKFDNALQGFMAKFSQIAPNALPIFVTSNAYLTDSTGCCIGGYHSATSGGPGGQTYIHASYVTTSGAFAEDVSALSHEVGEWMDDPFTNNNSPCGALEVGDPLEGFAHYGTAAYTLNGSTYHLQDLVYLTYFGAPASGRANGWSTFLGATIGVCAKGA